MKQCKCCGRKNPDENSNCISCGALLPDQPSERSESNANPYGSYANHNNGYNNSSIPAGSYANPSSGNNNSSIPAGSYANPNSGYNNSSIPAGSYANPDNSYRNSSAPAGSYANPGNAYDQNNEYGQNAAYGQPAAPSKYPSGGLIAWAVVTLLFCRIPGIVALVYALSINSSATVADQQKKISNAKLWCIIGTVLGVLSILLAIVSGVLSRSAVYRGSFYWT